MKKFFTTILILFFASNLVFAREENLGFRGPLNFIQCKVLEKIISMQIRKVVNGKIDTNVKSYGAKALRNGIFKSAEFEAKDLNVDGVHITRVYAKTITENNRIDISDKQNPKLLTDILAEYKAEVTNSDLKTLLLSEEYVKRVAKINAKIAPLARIYDTDIYCENNRLYFKLMVLSDLVFGGKITISGSTDIYSNGYKTELRDIKFNKRLKMNISDNLIRFINDLNPVNIVIKELGDAKIYVTAEEINIINDKIEISGIIKIYKD